MAGSGFSSFFVSESETGTFVCKFDCLAKGGLGTTTGFYRLPLVALSFFEAMFCFLLREEWLV